MSSSTSKRTPTVWIWILVILAALLGLFNLVDAARLMGWLPIAALGELKFFLPNAYWLGALINVLLAVFWFWVTRMLYNLDARAWIIVIVLAFFNVAVLVLALVGRTTFQSVMWEFILNAGTLIIALLPSTRKAFTLYD